MRELCSVCSCLPVTRNVQSVCGSVCILSVLLLLFWFCCFSVWVVLFYCFSYVLLIQYCFFFLKVRRLVQVLSLSLLWLTRLGLLGLRLGNLSLLSLLNLFRFAEFRIPGLHGKLFMGFLNFLVAPCRCFWEGGS